MSNDYFKITVCNVFSDFIESILSYYYVKLTIGILVWKLMFLEYLKLFWFIK